MNLSIREHIINNFKGDNYDTLRRAIDESVASQDEVKAPAGGVFGWVVSSWNKFKNKIRPGTKADKVAKTEKTSANDAFSDKANFVPNNASLKKEMFNEETKNKDIQQKTVPQTKIDAEVKKYLVDEYKIVHGIAPDEKETERYFGLVAKEQENDADAPKDMLEYLVSRHKNFEKTIENVSFGHRKEYDQDLRKIDERKSVNKNINAEEAKRKLYINKTRQTMWQSNLGNDGASDMTLLDFEKIMTFEVSNGGDRSLITQSQDHKKAPNRKGKQATKNPLNLKEKIRNENRDI